MKAACTQMTSEYGNRLHLMWKVKRIQNFKYKDREACETSERWWEGNEAKYWTHQHEL